MFMVKDEFANIKNLLKVRLIIITNKIWLFIVAGILLAGSLGSTVYGILENSDGFKHFIINDFSVSFLFGMGIGFIIIMFTYRQTNAKLSVFPQTNNSRFISSMIVNHIGAAVALLIVLAMYLLNLSAVHILSVFRDNIRLALTIDASFIVMGFFVYLAYIFIIIALIGLAGAILRKWTYYAAVVFIALGALILINRLRVIQYAPRVLAFLIGEPSLPLFFVKAFGVWFVLTAASLVINRFTIYSKGQNKTATKGVVIACVATVAVIMFAFPIILAINTSHNGSVLVSEAESVPVEDDYTGHDTTRIDVSHLPRGSKINIIGTNIVIPDEDGSVSYNNYNEDAVVIGAEALNNLQGDTLIVDFRPAEYIVNGIEILQYTNQRVTAHIDGDTLTLDHTRDSASVVIMPIWGIVRQFDRFNDKGILPANSLGFSSGWWGSTNIFISVE